MLSATALATIGGVNIFGSWSAGWLGGRYPKYILLGLLYLCRSAVLAIVLLIPPTPTTTIVFAAAMGMLWLGVIPLVSGYVAELFGTRYMATILGISFVVHQMGSVIGAWGGGLIFDAFGSYDRHGNRCRGRRHGRRGTDPVRRSGAAAARHARGTGGGVTLFRPDPRLGKRQHGAGDFSPRHLARNGRARQPLAVHLDRRIQTAHEQTRHVMFAGRRQFRWVGETERHPKTRPGQGDVRSPAFSASE